MQLPQRVVEIAPANFLERRAEQPLDEPLQLRVRQPAECFRCIDAA